jgi:hypothetical protein
MSQSIEARKVSVPQILTFHIRQRAGTLYQTHRQLLVEKGNK